MFRKKEFAEFFVFSRRDRLGIVVLVVLIAGVSLLPRFFGKNIEINLQELNLDSILQDTSNMATEEDLAGQPDLPRHDASQKVFTPTALFEFDPNTLSLEGWKKLGLEERTARTILNYTSKGGKFRKPDDLKKIWGMPEGFYEQVKGWVHIDEMLPEPGAANHKRQAAGNEMREDKVGKKSLVIYINESDSADWERLPGIGGRLSARIVAFREKLGGFYSVDQLREVYGLPDSTYLKILPFLRDGGNIKQFDINRATKEELAAHPFIRYKLANAIIAYREQHGSIKNLDELKRFEPVAGQNFEKMLKYVVVNGP